MYPHFGSALSYSDPVYVDNKVPLGARLSLLMLNEASRRRDGLAVRRKKNVRGKQLINMTT